MFDRRHRIDPETARLIEQRLEHLLLEPPEGRGGASFPIDDHISTPDELSAADQASAADPALSARPAPRRQLLDEVLERLSPTTGRRRGEEPQARGETTTAPTTGPAGRWRSALLSRTHLGVLAALAVIALLAAGWLLLRARPVALASPVAAPTTVVAPTGTASSPVPTSASPGRPSATPSGPASPSPVLVHVLGAVRRPGVVELTEGARVADALRRAGGLTRRADPGRLNLAAAVVDGQQVYVGTKDDPAGEVSGGGASSGGDTSGGGAPPSASAEQSVDLNTATSAQLEQLPGVGPVTADKILAWRQEHGRFSRVEELQEVSGIGPKTYAEIAPHCRV